MLSGRRIPDASLVLHGMVLWVFQRRPLPGKDCLVSELFSAVGDAFPAQPLMTLPQAQSYDSSSLLRIAAGVILPQQAGLWGKTF